jgi:hypothetical protein
MGGKTWVIIIIGICAGTPQPGAYSPGGIQTGYKAKIFSCSVGYRVLDRR